MKKLVKIVLKELNEKRINDGLEPFKNCRNLTSGTVKSLNPSVAAERKLGVMVYGIAQAKELGFKKHSEALDFLKKQGFKLNQEIQVCNSVEEVKNFIYDKYGEFLDYKDSPVDKGKEIFEELYRRRINI